MQVRKELWLYTFHVDDAYTWLHLFRLLHHFHFTFHFFEVQKNE